MTDLRIGKTIKALSNEIGRFMTEYTNDGESNFTMIQFNFIAYIGRESVTRSVYQKDLEATFNIRRSTASGILQRMERNEWITRVPSSKDGRLKRIELTENGQKVFWAKKKRLDEINDLLVQDIAPADLAVFYRVIDEIYGNLAVLKNNSKKESAE